MIRIKLAVLAITIGIVMIGIYVAVRSIATSTAPELPGTAPVPFYEVGFISLPFLILAAVGVTNKASWVTGIVLTAAFWTLFLYGTNTSEGANIGLGLLLIVSPALIAIVCLIVARYAESRR